MKTKSPKPKPTTSANPKASAELRSKELLERIRGAKLAIEKVKKILGETDLNLLPDYPAGGKVGTANFNAAYSDAYKTAREIEALRMQIIEHDERMTMRSNADSSQPAPKI